MQICFVRVEVGLLGGRRYAFDRNVDMPPLYILVDGGKLMSKGQRRIDMAQKLPKSFSTYECMRQGAIFFKVGGVEKVMKQMKIQVQILLTRAINIYSSQPLVR